MLQLVPKSVWNPRRRTLAGSEPRLLGSRLLVTDTLGELNPACDLNPACQGEAAVLANLSWQLETFEARFENIGDGDIAISFPSPLAEQNPAFATATMDWYYARDRAGRVIDAPAVVILDILQGGNLVAGFIARTLSKNGIHGLVLHLPQNGRRRLPEGQHDWAAFLPSLKQAACDARRARDVVANLPHVTTISLQGTSLGGFVAAMAGSIDSAFDANILALTGGDVYGVLSTGKMDAARVRQHLREAGYTDEKLKDELWQLEPLRIAHRLNPQKTWLFSARYDQVVPAIHGKKLAEAIGLDWSHHRQLAGCHYTCAINVNRFMAEMMRAIPRTAKAIRRSA